jgi:hypothetical protein
MAALSRSALRLIVRGRGGQQLTGCLRASQAGGHQPERLERGSPCRLLKLRLIGAHGVHMKEVLPWLVRTRDFCPALAALVSQEQNIFSSPHTISIICPNRWAGSRAASPVS